MDSSRSWFRRDLLRAGGVVLGGGLAGCQSLTERQQTTPTTDGTTTAVSSPSCGPGNERVDTFETPDVAYGELKGLTLTAHPESVQRGDELTVTLTNETDEEQVTGNRSKYMIHRSNGGEWRSIFGKAEGDTIGYTDEGIGHRPGEGFTWKLTVTQDGLAHTIKNGGGRLIVCDPISPGTYRFLFHGWGRYEDGELRAYLATRFTVTA